jgi:endonuclease/exonuclease/phosphatase family metal-dependent hydrolase
MAASPLQPLDRNAPAGRDLLTVGSYNIHRCVGSDMRHDVERVARVILELKCDTVGLQEVDSSPGIRTDSRQLDLLARATGMQPIAATNLLPHGSRHGNALLTTRDFGAVRRYDLTVEGREPRGALDVELHAAGRVVRVIVTHLGVRAAERRAQVKKLMTVLRGIPSDSPLVVLGDLNEWLPFGRPLRWLHGLLGKPPARRSYPVWAPMFALDRVWSRPPGALLTLQVHRSSDARRASDHFPMKAVLAPDVDLRRSQRFG